MIRTNSPAIAGTKYVSATDAAAVAVGAVVACAEFATKEVSAYDGQ